MSDTGNNKLQHQTGSAEIPDSQSVSGSELSLPGILNSIYKGFANDIKSPVNAIVGFSNLLAEQGVTAEVRKKYLDIILNSSDELLYIVNNISELADLEENLKKTEQTRINISSELKDLEDSFSSRARLRKQKFRLAGCENIPDEYIVSDLNKFRQIMNSLIYISFKLLYSTDIELRYSNIQKEVNFRISDGSTMENAERQKMQLLSYLQGNNLFATGKVGIDSGIFLACRYAEFIGGNIMISAGDGENTVIYFTLPSGPVQAESVNPKETGQKTGLDTDSRKVILVAEDDDNNYPLIENIFLRMNLRVLRAVNGKEVVELALRENIDLVFMDIKMPVMDGYTATRIILESKPEMKIIAQTAYFGDRDHALKNGCIDFIAKPFSKKQVTDIVMKYL